MKVTIDFNESSIKPAIEMHLTQGIKVQDYIENAVIYFSKMLLHESSGMKCGYGDNNNFSRYNTEYSPSRLLKEVE